MGANGKESIASSTAPLSSCSKIEPGMRVCLHSLRNNADLNGQEGIAVEFVSADGRWKIDMHDGSGRRLKPENLRPVVDERKEETDDASNYDEGKEEEAENDDKDDIAAEKI